jgi:hypothetical protein
MDREAYAFALRNTLTELQNVCPDITNAFMFKDGNTLAGDKNTPEKTMDDAVQAFDSMLEKAETLGGLESITLEARNGTVNVSLINDISFVMVTSKKADMNYINTLTRVLIPTVLKVLDNINPAPLKNKPLLRELEPEPKRETPPIEEPQEPEMKLLQRPVLRARAPEEPEKNVKPETKPEVKPEIQSEPWLPEPPVNQLIVEKLGGLLAPSDTVRIDAEILSQWAELYEGRKISEVELETFGGKKARFKVKPIKDSKYGERGMIQAPEKVQLELEINKGELVRVKPVVE